MKKGDSSPATAKPTASNAIDEEQKKLEAEFREDDKGKKVHLM